MPFTNQKSFGPIIWIPPQYTANWKLTVERSDGTVDDITDEIISLTIEDGATETIGNFEFEVPNPNETYTDAWTGMEVVKFYCEYAPGTPTTLVFGGRIEKPSKQGNNVKVTGRVEALFVFDQTITKVYTTIDAGVILKDIFDTYGEGRFDTSEINTNTGTLISVEWVDKNFWEAVTDICFQTGYDCYINHSLVVKFFENGSVDNQADAIVHDSNLMETGDFAPDIQFVKNEVRVYGSSTDGVQIIYTAKDLVSQDKNGIRRRNIKEDSITTYTQAKELADFSLSNEKDPPQIGDVKSILLASIQPGENLRISDPYNGINPGYYRILKYKHEISDDGLFTTVTINKEPKRISHVLKDQISKESKKSGVAKNNFDMDFSNVDVFNEDVGSHSNTQITDGVLRKISSGIDGVWISNVFQSPNGNNISEFVLRANGNNLPGTSFEVSLDGGASYQTTSLDALTTPSSTIGPNITVKITLQDDDSRIDSYEIQFTTD